MSNLAENANQAPIIASAPALWAALQRMASVYECWHLWLRPNLHFQLRRPLLQHHTEFHPDGLESVQENEANQSGFALTFSPFPKVAPESGIK